MNGREAYITTTPPQREGEMIAANSTMSTSKPQYLSNKALYRFNTQTGTTSISLLYSHVHTRTCSEWYLRIVQLSQAIGPF